MSNFALRYAPHLGYISPTPLFANSVETTDPYAHARFAAENGFAGLFHPWVGDRSGGEIAAFKRGLDEFDLTAGTIVCAPAEDALRPLWVSRRTEDRELLLGHLEQSAALARELGSKTVAAVIMSDLEVGSAQVQMANARDNLGFAAEVVERYGVSLGIEPMVAVPGMLLQSAYTTGELIDKVDHPSVGLIFDTGHITAMDGSILDAQAALQRLVCVYQLADMPDRKEPGAGVLDLPTFLARLIRIGYQGLVELEHDWSANTAEAEAAGILLLRQIDAEAARLANTRQDTASHQEQGR